METLQVLIGVVVGGVYWYLFKIERRLIRIETSCKRCEDRKDNDEE